MVDPVLTTAAALSVQTPFTAKGQRDIDAMVSVIFFWLFLIH